MRCAKHGLATAQDGQCVLCRREARSRRPAPPSPGAGAASWVGPNLLLLGMLGVVAASLLGARTVAGMGPVAPRQSLPTSSTSEPQSTPAVPSAPDFDELGPVQIKLYYAPWCPACKAARAWLRSQGIPYEGLNVQASPTAAQRLRQLNPRGTIPTFEVDGRVLVGFDEQALSSALDAADARRRRRREDQ